MERDFKGIWIPKEIWLNTHLTMNEKLFLVEIDSLDNEKGCFASNDYFAEFFGLSKNRCSEIIKSLEKKGFLSVSYKYKAGTKAIESRIIKLLEISIGVLGISTVVFEISIEVLEISTEGIRKTVKIIIQYLIIQLII